MRNIRSLALCMLAFVTLGASAQVGIGNTDPKAALDVTSTNQGILIPRTTKTLVALPDEGETIWDTDLKTYCWYTQGNWKCLSEIGNNLPGNTSTGLFNQSQWVSLNGSAAYGRLLLNSNTTLNPTTTSIVGTDNGSADEDLRGKIRAGSYRLQFSIHLSSRSLNKASYFTIRTLSNGATTAQTFIVPETLNVGEGSQITFQFIFSSDANSVIWLEPLGEGIPNNMKFKFEKLTTL